MNWNSRHRPGLAGQSGGRSGGAPGIGPGGPEVFWRLVADGQGGYLLGAGHGGEIFHVDRMATRFWPSSRPRKSSACSLAPTARCWPAAGPRAAVPDGPGRRGRTCWGKWKAVTSGPWSGTRSSSRSGWLPAARRRSIATIRSGPQQELVLPAQNALEILPAAGFLVATQGPGLVYRLDPDHRAGSRCFSRRRRRRRASSCGGPDGDWFLLALNPPPPR